MARFRRIEPRRRIDPLEIGTMAGLRRKLLEVLQLRPSISLAKRMDVVQVAHDDAGLPGEFGRREAAQESRLRQPPVYVAHTGGDILPELKLISAFADLDGAKLPSPVIDILE